MQITITQAAGNKFCAAVAEATAMTGTSKQVAAAENIRCAFFAAMADWLWRAQRQDLPQIQARISKLSEHFSGVTATQWLDAYRAAGKAVSAGKAANVELEMGRYLPKPAVRA